MQFTVRRGHEEFGPYTLDQLRQFVNEGRILPNDHVYDGQNWIYVNQVISTQQPVLNMPSGAPLKLIKVQIFNLSSPMVLIWVS